MRLIDSCITQLKGQNPSRTYTKSKEEEERKYQPRSEVAADLKGHEDGAVLRCPQPPLPPSFEFRMREWKNQCKDLVVLIIDKKNVPPSEFLGHVDLQCKRRRRHLQPEFGDVGFGVYCVVSSLPFHLVLSLGFRVSGLRFRA